MTDSYANAPTTKPPTFVTPAEPRPLLSECMLRSTFLFPSGMGSDIENNNDYIDDANRESGNNAKSEYEPIVRELENCLEPCRSYINEDERPIAKKSVRFDATPNFYPLAGPCASDMSTQEKRDVWYGPNDYDRFKFLAAKLAGVKITRHDDSHRFFVTGYFNKGHTGGQGKGGPGRDTTTDGPGAAGAARSDSHTISKRGLGYHLSHRRKQARVVAQAAVVTWQKKLCGQTTGSEVQLILAYASEKLSRRARREAQWRGKVDFLSAYPERRRARLPPLHPPPLSVVTRLPLSMTHSRTNNSGVTTPIKRSHDDGDGTLKGRRTDGRGCCSGKGESSRGNRGRASEVTQAETRALGKNIILKTVGA